MTVQPLSGNDLLALEVGNVRRVTLLTAWTLTLLYVLLDLLIRWGVANNIEVLNALHRLVPASPVGQGAIFLVALLGLWAVFYSRDDLTEQLGERNLCYRLGNLAYARPFTICCLCAALVSAGVAVQYQVASIPYWLLFALIVVSCSVGLVEDGASLASGVRWRGMRLRLILRRVPFFGRFVSIGPVVQARESGLATEESAAPAAAPAQSPPADAEPARQGDPTP